MGSSSTTSRAAVGSVSKAILTASLILLTGCTSLPEYVRNGFKVGPNYAKPPAPVEESWIDAADVRVRSDDGEISKWWKVFNDPTLDDLICHAYKQNLSLREAGFRVLEARAHFGTTVGEFFPQSQYVSGSFTRNATSIAQLLGGSFGSFASTPGTTTPSIRRYFNQDTINFGAAWELDFWGRFRRAIEASSAELDASVDNYDDVLVTLLGDVATNYVQFRVLEQQIELLQANAKFQKETLDVARARFKFGAKDSEIDLPQAQTTLSQTLAQIPPTKARLRARTNRLCVLLGMPPEELETRLAKTGIPAAPKDAAAGMPAELLRRRPDVRRAERQVAAESARIGVAVADLYPQISINGSFGWQAPKIDQLFTTPAFQGSYGPGFQWNVLNYGRLYNRVKFQRAKFEETVAAYQNKVLTAAEEVENGLAAFLQSQEQVKELNDSVVAARRARDVGAEQYRAGRIDFNRLSVLELNLVQQQNLQAQAIGDVALGLIQVYRAMGGGWEIRFEDCTPTLDLSPTNVRGAARASADRGVATGQTPVVDLQFSEVSVDSTPGPAPRDSR